MTDRPRYTAPDKYRRTEEDATYVERMVAVGEVHGDICIGLGIDMATLKRLYADELLNGAVRQRQTHIVRVFDGAEAGKTGLVKQLFEMFEKGSMMQHAQNGPAPTPGAQPQQPTATVTRLGKKAKLVEAASNPDTSDPMGRLMHRRQGESE